MKIFKRTSRDDAGFDGTTIVSVDVRVTERRSIKQDMRCRPGTFEWRYARKNADLAVYHAGIRFAELWESAGTSHPSSPDYGEPKGGGEWRGLPEKRWSAMKELKAVREDLGNVIMSRLVDYCVLGLTAAQIGASHGISERDVAPVLHQDIRACAIAFGFLRKAA